VMKRKYFILNKRAQVCVQTLVNDDNPKQSCTAWRILIKVQVRCNGLSLKGNFRAGTVVVNRAINFAL